MHEHDEKQPSPEGTAKKRWTTPSLKHVGHVGEVLQGGGGKLTAREGDPGEPRKVKGQG
ncbi:MAG: hypothetical protein U0P82_10520 [Vicinamibacterales bacterium]